MKPWLWAAAISMLLCQCKSDSATGADTAGAATASAAAAAPAGGGSFRSPLPVPMNTREAVTLTKNYWVFEYYIDPDNPINNRINRGRWYKLNPDGTFESGHWDQKTANGSWGLGKAEDNNYLMVHFDSSIDAEDSEFMIQGINDQEDAMSWVGTDLYKQGQIMIKAIQLLSIPTKKQFGIEE
jgi:hypothetical protein